ncbi:type II toxin-antitoxin system RelE/ParE family toxin [Paracoccus sp. MC1862]|nr:type II toxin-antitoxin system RelE/ParE family toxin [Paracoccus sp. MC1862]
MHLTRAAEGDLIRIFSRRDRPPRPDAGRRPASGACITALPCWPTSPAWGRLRPGFRQPIRSLPVGSHLTLYPRLDGEVRVVRIRHHPEDWFPR